MGIPYLCKHYCIIYAEINKKRHSTEEQPVDIWKTKILSRHISLTGPARLGVARLLQVLTLGFIPIKSPWEYDDPEIQLHWTFE
jgi:hypothetical protein